MNYELIKKEFIKLKKEELNYINDISIISKNKKLSEYEKIEIYRNLKNYEVQLNEKLKKIHQEIVKIKTINSANCKDIIIEFELDKNLFSLIEPNNSEYKEILLEQLGIDIKTFTFKLTLYSLIHLIRWKYKTINSDIIQNEQKLFETPIYIFSNYYDKSDEICGFFFGNYEDLIYGVYENINSNYYSKDTEIQKKKMEQFEKENIIIHSTNYVRPSEIKQIFNEELLNIKNSSLNDCIIETRKIIEELNYIRSPEYKEKILLNKINELYKSVKGEFIQQEILYSGSFLNILSETYKLPNQKTINKEKIIKNGGKNSVIIIPLDQDKQYIITFQNRIKDQIIAEFPSGYIENNEDPIQAAKRELQEETGYTTDDLFIVDEAFTSPGIDNSITYIVLANNCIKNDNKISKDTELISHGLFSEIELKYLIYNNIMNGSMNKLAYYNLINNVNDCNFTCISSNKKIYKELRKKTNPLYNSK